MKNLCMAGGVALNCVANGRILREGPLRGHLGAAGGRRRGRRARARRSSGNSCSATRAPSSDGARLSGARRISRRRDPRLPRQNAGCPTASCPHDEMLGDRRRLDEEQARGRLVPGPHGVRAALARRAQHPGRRAQSQEQGCASTSRSSSARASGPSRPPCSRSAWPSGSTSTARARTCCSCARCERRTGADDPRRSPTWTARRACRP